MKKKASYTKLEHANHNHANTFIVNWMAGNTCNYSCSYCPDYLHNGTSPWLSYSVVTEFCDKIITHYTSKKIVFEFTGGEITMWPDFIQVAAYLHARNIDISIISNGSRTLRWWETAVPYLKRVHLSFHPEQGDQKQFENVVAYLYNKTSLHVNIMMHPSCFETCRDFASQLEHTYPVSVSRQPLLHQLKGSLYTYSREELSIMGQSQSAAIEADQTHVYRSEMTKAYPDGERTNHSCNYFLSSFENNWNDWLCFAGLEQIVVTQTGDVYRGWCMSGGKIGHISQHKIVFPTNPVCCDQYECSCNFDILCTKIKQIY